LTGRSKSKKISSSRRKCDHCRAYRVCVSVFIVRAVFGAGQQVRLKSKIIQIQFENSIIVLWRPASRIIIAYRVIIFLQNCYIVYYSKYIKYSTLEVQRFYSLLNCCRVSTDFEVGDVKFTRAQQNYLFLWCSNFSCIQVI